MDFTLDQFANRIIDLFTNSQYFPESADPYINSLGGSEELSKKHKGRNPIHLKDVAGSSMRDSIIGTETLVSFDYGNEKLEEIYPHYHILQQAPVIRKAGYATEKTRGSQGRLKPSDRDFEKVHWNGKTFTKEYSRNVRGKRLSLTKTSYWSGGKTSSGSFIHREAYQYLNIHLGYIDKALDELAPIIADEFGLKKGGKSNTGFGEEYGLQIESTYTTDIIGILESFM